MKEKLKKVINAWMKPERNEFMSKEIIDLTIECIDEGLIKKNAIIKNKDGYGDNELLFALYNNRISDPLTEKGRKVMSDK
jgi:hypothetical protein